jgi:lipase
MVLRGRCWGEPAAEAVVCLHGLAQHGGVFAELGGHLAERGHSVLAVDLRGHGESGREPPWNGETHLDDVFETLAEHGIERPTWVGHSFGGRLAAAAAAREPERSERLVLLDPGLEVPPDKALQGAEIDRLDWSFATVEGAINVLLTGPSIVATPREVVAAYAREDVVQGADGRYRFRFSPSAAVVAWSEMSLPAPPIARIPTLVVRAAVPLVYGEEQARRYEEDLGGLLTAVTVPNGHNLLWESPRETIDAVAGFLETASAAAESS